MVDFFFGGDDQGWSSFTSALTYLKGGRLHHRTLTPKQAELMRLAIANYRKAKKLLRTWEVHTQRLI